MAVVAPRRAGVRKLLGGVLVGDVFPRQRRQAVQRIVLDLVVLEHRARAVRVGRRLVEPVDRGLGVYGVRVTRHERHADVQHRVHRAQILAAFGGEAGHHHLVLERGVLQRRGRLHAIRLGHDGRGRVEPRLRLGAAQAGVKGVGAVAGEDCAGCGRGVDEEGKGEREDPHVAGVIGGAVKWKTSEAEARGQR